MRDRASVVHVVALPNGRLLEGTCILSTLGGTRCSGVMLEGEISSDFQVVVTGWDLSLGVDQDVELSFVSGA